MAHQHEPRHTRAFPNPDRKPTWPEQSPRNQPLNVSHQGLDGSSQFSRGGMSWLSEKYTTPAGRCDKVNSSSRRCAQQDLRPSRLWLPFFDRYSELKQAGSVAQASEHAALTPGRLIRLPVAAQKS